MQEIISILTPLLELAVAAAVAVVSPYMIKFLQAHVDAKQLEALTQFAKMAVQSMQQQIGNGPGDEKKQIAMAVLRGLLEQKNYKFTDETIHNAIEAAVLQMKQETAASLSVSTEVTHVPDEVHESGMVLSVKAVPAVASDTTTGLIVTDTATEQPQNS